MTCDATSLVFGKIRKTRKCKLFMRVCSGYTPGVKFLLFFVIRNILSSEAVLNLILK